MTTFEVPERAGRREWIGLAVLALPTMLTTVDISVLFLALPRLSEDLGAGPTEQLWITDIYGFMIAGFLVTMGTLGDRVGRRKVLLTGAAVFCLASVFAAYSTSTPMLIISRAVLGISAATLMPSILSLISTMFRDPRQMGTAIGIWVSAIMAGVVLGPAIGGLLLGAFWWGSVFLMGVPVMLVLLLAGPAVLPEYRDTAAGRLDLASVALSLGTLLPVVYGLKEAARGGVQPGALAGIIGGVAIGLTFIARQRRLDHPLVDLRLFANRALTSTLVIGLLVGFIMAGLGLSTTVHLQLVAGLSPLAVGLWLLIPSTLMIIGGNAGPALARGVKPASVMVVGMAVAAVGALVLTSVSAGTGFATLLTGLTIIYIGGSVIGPLINHMLLMSAPPEQAGAASALSSAGGELGVALGVAVLGSLGTAVYRGQVDIPPGIPEQAAQAARESISGATAAAATLPAEAGAALLETARAAYTSGLHTVAAVVAILFAGMAVLTAGWLRQVPPTGAGHHAPAEEPEAAPAA